jgi:hypothetical protein
VSGKAPKLNLSAPYRNYQGGQIGKSENRRTILTILRNPSLIVG